MESCSSERAAAEFAGVTRWSAKDIESQTGGGLSADSRQFAHIVYEPLKGWGDDLHGAKIR